MRETWSLISVCSTCRFFHCITGSEASKRAFLPKSTDFGVLEGMLQDPCAAPMCLPMDFLKAITQDFSQEREVGRGGYGVVYKVPCCSLFSFSFSTVVFLILIALRITPRSILHFIELVDLCVVVCRHLLCES